MVRFLNNNTEDIEEVITLAAHKKRLPEAIVERGGRWIRPFVFSSLNQRYPGQVLLRPTSEQLSLYGDSKTIVIRRLVSEAPKQSEAPYQVPLEKLIVDLFSNQDLLVSKGDYAYAIEEMFATYHIDTVAMLRYARRRNPEPVIKDFIERKTKVELV